MKNLLEIVQSFCGTTGLTKPVTVTASTDDQIIQILGLLNEGLTELVSKYKWPQLRLEASFTSSAAETQGELAELAPGFKAMVPDTLWNLTRQQRAVGGMSPQQTQAIKASNMGIGSIPSYSIREGQLLFVPSQPPSEAYRFEYISQYAVRAQDGKLKEHFTADKDVPILPDTLLIADLRWRWKAEKGLAYAENMRTFETICKQAFVDALGAGKISLATGDRSVRPGIVVPEGNWNV